MLPNLRSPKTNVVNFTFSFNRNSFTRIRFSLFLFFSFAAVWAQSQTIGTPTVTGVPVCEGSDVSISFLVTNGTGTPTFFTTSTNYLVFLSNSSGTDFTQIASFTSSTAPVSSNLATATITQSVTIPPGTASGTGYLISVGSTMPDFDGSTGANASAAFTVNRLPLVFTVTGGGTACSDIGVPVGLSGSSSNVNYQLKRNGVDVGSPVLGNGITPVSFGDQTVTGTYTVEATNVVTGCTDAMAGSASVIINPSPTATYSKTSVSCQGNDGSISVNATDGTDALSFSWTGPNGFTSTDPNITGLVPGDYTIVIQDDVNFCTKTIPGITVLLAPTLGVGILNKTNVSSCSLGSDDGSITVFRIGGVFDGVTPIRYSLTGGPVLRPLQTSNVFSDLPVGSYTVTVRDSKGCPGSHPGITLTQAAAVNVALAYTRDASSCGNGSDGSITVTATGGVLPYDYKLNGVTQLTTSLSSHTYSGLAAGSFMVTVTDSKGCTSSPLAVSIGQATSPVASVPYKGVTCTGGSTGFITVGVTGGVAPYLYSKDNGASFQTSYRFLNLAAATYNIVVKDHAGCPSAAVAVIIKDGTVPCLIAGTTTNSSLSVNKTTTNGIKVNVFPNPSRSDFTILLESKSEEPVQLKVISMYGKTVHLVSGSATQEYRFGTNFASGMYLLQVTQGKATATVKLVKGN